MTRASKWFVVAVLLVASCKSKPDCASAVNGANDRMMGEAKAKLPPEAFERVSKAAPKIIGVLVEVCEQDGWSAETLACMGAAGTQAEINASNDKLTPAQKEHLQKRSLEVLKDVLPGKF
jgi:hypothetical protein